MKKRICSVMMVLGLIILPIINALCVPAKPVKAAGALGVEQTIELMQILYSALANGMLVSGAVNADFTDADTAGVFTEFMNSMSKSIGGYGGELPSWAQDTIFTFDDGTIYTLGDLVEYVQVLDDPTETGEELAPGTWGQLGMTKADWLDMQRKEFDLGEGGETPPEEPTEPDPGEEPTISSFIVASGFFGMLADFISDIYNGATSVPAKDYFNENYYDGRYNSNDSHYFISMKRFYPQWNEYSVFNVNGEGYGYALLRTSNTTIQEYSIARYIATNQTLNTNVNLPVTVYNYASDGTMMENTGNISTVQRGENYVLSTNLPQFETQDAMLRFYQENDKSGITNKAPLDISSLIGNGISGSLSIFEGKKVKPKTFLDTYKAIDNAYDTQIAPNITDDPVANTDLFNQVMTSTTTEVAADAEVAPETDPGTDPGTTPGTETGTDNENINNYKTDLTMIFPFCLPFDFIHLLNVLDAEPIAPKFEIPFVVSALNIDEVVTIDMSFMETAMEIFRMGELICFILLLIKASSKLIRW